MHRCCWGGGGEARTTQRGLILLILILFCNGVSKSLNLTLELIQWKCNRITHSHSRAWYPSWLCIVASLRPKAQGLIYWSTLDMADGRRAGGGKRMCCDGGQSSSCCPNNERLVGRVTMLCRPLPIRTLNTAATVTRHWLIGVSAHFYFLPMILFYSTLE